MPAGSPCLRPISLRRILGRLFGPAQAEKPAHKLTRANDSKALSALLCHFFRASAQSLHFAMRNEALRMRPLKPLKGLGAANQSFRRFV